MSGPFKIPQQIAAALSSGRPELLTIGPVTLDESAQREVLRMLAAMITDREAMRDRIAHLEKRLRAAIQGARGAIDALEDSLDGVRDLEKDL